MKTLTNRVLIASLLLTPSMVFAKPKPKKKKPKPAPAEETQPTEDLADPAPAQAAAPVAQATPSYSKAYGMAGCGVGSYVVKEDSVLQIFAATTNGTVYNQLFGISFGTLNCGEPGASVAMEQKVFIDANLASLKQEAAKGQGETLNAFADLLGCEAQNFAQVSKTNYGEIYKDAEASVILSSYKAVLNTQCARLI